VTSRSPLSGACVEELAFCAASLLHLFSSSSVFLIFPVSGVCCGQRSSFLGRFRAPFLAGRAPCRFPADVKTGFPSRELLHFFFASDEAGRFLGILVSSVRVFFSFLGAFLTPRNTNPSHFLCFFLTSSNDVPPLSRGLLVDPRFFLPRFSGRAPFFTSLPLSVDVGVALVGVCGQFFCPPPPPSKPSSPKLESSGGLFLFGFLLSVWRRSLPSYS